MSLQTSGQLAQGGANRKNIFGSPYLRDYTHASKTFKAADYANAPKLKFLFHTYFDINQEAYSEGLGTGVNFGVLVREVKLPAFTFNTEQLNQYNRKRIVQTKIKYEPVNITFHDDNSNKIAKLWNAYYTYYYRDGAKPKVVFAGNQGGQPISTPGAGGVVVQPTLADYNNRNQYAPSITGNDDWGYVGESRANQYGVKIPFFKNITIFGMNQHKFIAYTLINPMITQFAHDTYNYDEGNGVMKNVMTVDYETVVYNSGDINGEKPGDIVAGFGDIASYDKTLSPNGNKGSNQTVTR